LQARQRSARARQRAPRRAAFRRAAAAGLLSGRRRMLRRAAFITALVLLLVAAVLFVALNRQSFDVDLAVVRFGVSSGLALLIAFAAGLLAGALWSSASIARLLGER